MAYRAGIEDKPYAYLDQEIRDNDAKNFAKALFSYLIQSPERSVDFLDKLENHNNFTDYLQALSLSATSNNEKGLDIVQKRLDIDPNNVMFSMLYSQLTQSKPIYVRSNFLYERRLVWRANIQYYKSSNNIPMALYYRAMLDFSQGKSKSAQYLIQRAKRDAADSEKNTIIHAEEEFKLITEAEKKEDLEEDK
ncbi:MAG: hypothetical protein ACPGRG_08345 [Marinomonas sp.]